MSIRVMGALFVFSGCGWFGFSMANAHRHHERILRQMIRATEYMECELQFRQTPLPQLCHNTAQAVDRDLGRIFLKLEEQLERRTFAEVSACMATVLKEEEVSQPLKEIMEELGRTLGQFDLTGQLQNLRALRAGCEDSLKELSQNRESRLRSYQTLGLCTGAALAVLLI